MTAEIKQGELFRTPELSASVEAAIIDALKASHRAAEVEVEAVAYIVTTRLGLTGESAPYLSGYVTDHALPAEVSFDNIAKVASRVERMAQQLLAAPRPLPPTKVASARGAT